MDTHLISGSHHVVISQPRRVLDAEQAIWVGRARSLANGRGVPLELVGTTTIEAWKTH